MKIAYVNCCPTDGAFNKIVGQSRAAKKLGLDIGFVVLTDHQNARMAIDNKTFFCYFIANN